MNTHLPILKLVCAAIAFPSQRMNKTLEFGSGFFSTSFFLENSKEHTAIEMLFTIEDERNRSRGWYEILTHMVSNFMFFPLILESTEAVEFLKNSNETFDVIFVDADMRVACVNEAFKHTGVVIAHDTESDWAGWENVVVPEGWEQFTKGNNVNPDPDGAWTTVWTNKSRIKHILKTVGVQEMKIPRSAV